jgi:hypothetical protein
MDMFLVTALSVSFKYKWYIGMYTYKYHNYIYYDSKAQEVSPDDTKTQSVTEPTATRNNTRTGDNYVKNKKLN